MKLTDWIPGDIKPVRVGVYERSYGNALPAYCYWDGKFWGMYGPTPNQAIRWKSSISGNQTLPWRGLAEKP